MTERKEEQTEKRRGVGRRQTETEREDEGGREERSWKVTVHPDGKEGGRVTGRSH